MDQQEVKALKAFALRIRLATLDAIHSLGSGHLGGALSIADAMAVLYGREMNIRVEDPLGRPGQTGLLQGPRRPRGLRHPGCQGLLPL